MKNKTLENIIFFISILIVIMIIIANFLVIIEQLSRTDVSQITEVRNSDIMVGGITSFWLPTALVFALAFILLMFFRCIVYRLKKEENTNGRTAQELLDEA